jgi:4-amino-4-deoxy-L-arabinose transferase-like glycosyltransferase
VHVVSLVNTSDLRNGLFQLEKRIPLLAFPILFYFKVIEQDLARKVASVFIVSVGLACVVCLSLSVYFSVTGLFRNPSFDFASLFFYENLSRQVDLHPTYLSMYILLCLVVLLNEQQRKWPLIAFFILMLLLLSSRMALISFPVVLIVMTLIKMNKRTILQSLGLILLFATLLVLLFFLSPTVWNRQFAHYLSFDPEAGYTGISMRIVHWKASVQAIKGHYLWGTGVGDTQRILDVAYHELGYDNFMGFNSHSQFMWDLLTLGIFGLAILLANFILPMVLAFRKRDTVYFSFLLIVLLFCLTECVFFVNKGIAFFGFFNSLFLLNDRNNRQTVG